MTQISFDPYIPLALWVPLALATAAMLAWYAAAGRRRLPKRRWWAVVALMALAATVPLLVLLNPTWLEQVPPPAGKPLLTVLVDRSASMATRDAPGGETRYQAGVALATAVAGQLKDQYEVRLRWFAATSAPCSPEALAGASPDGAATDLAAAVQGALEDDRPQGQAMLLLSDGIHNTGGAEPLRQAAAKARAMAVPVYAKTIGGPAVVNDLEVTVEQPQELAFAGQRVPMAVNLRQRGKLGEKTTLSLWRGEELVEKRDVALRPDDAVEEVFYVTHKQSGLYRYEVRAEALPGEATTANNAAPLLLRVIDQPIRMLLLEGKPYWDTKFLVRTLSNDPSVELTSVVQLAEGRLLRRKIPRHPPPAEEKRPAAATAGDREEWTIETDAAKLLADADALNSYQVVVLGRNTEVFLTDDALAKLRKWLVESEGSLVCFRGAPASQIGQRLGELMPVRWTPTAETHYNMQLTGTAQALHWLPAGKDGLSPLAELPPLATAAQPEAAKALSVVLATGVVGALRPARSGDQLSARGQRTGRRRRRGGHVALGVSPAGPPEAGGNLRLALAKPRPLAGGASGPVAFAAAGPADRRDQLQRRRKRHGDPADPRLEGRAAASGTQRGTAGAAADLRLRATRQLSWPVPRRPGPAARRAVRAPRAGRRRADPSAATAFEVRQNTAERLDVRAQPAVMQMLARESGGAVLERVEPRLLATEFHEYLARTRPQRTARTMAWDRWWALSGALMIWAAAWSLRRRSGLV